MIRDTNGHEIEAVPAASAPAPAPDPSEPAALDHRTTTVPGAPTDAPGVGREVSLPASCLVVLIGVSGSGKSTFAGRHFGPFETVSSDYCRGLVSNDPNDQEATNSAFEVLDYIVGKRLDANLLTVVDATNVQRAARASLVKLARSHDVLPVAIVLDVPEKVAVARNANRTDRDFGRNVIARQRSALRSSLRGLSREGFRQVHVLRGEREIDQVRITRHPLLPDMRDQHGPFDVIGDVHGCLGELVRLLTKLDYDVVVDEAGRPVDAVHRGGADEAARRAIFVGDLVDRGPDSVGVLRLVMGMVRAGHALAVPGNHEHKLTRALAGRDVQAKHGLETTLAELSRESQEFRDEVRRFCHDLVSHLVFDDGNLVVAHAGLTEGYQLKASGRVRSFALYGDTTGESDEYGLPVRYPWARDYRGRAMVLYGHTPTVHTEWVNNTMCLDTGCVFGGKLTALRYPEKQIVQVDAAEVYYEPARPFLPDDPRFEGSTPTGSDSPEAREPGLLSLTDVAGKRVIETSLMGRVTIPEENAAGALEVMSRFALDPRLLVYLPPTMSPVATSSRPEYLEHPDEAFSQYLSDGVDQVVCEEKHMGSRGVILVARDSGEPSGSAVIRERFGIDAPGAIHTRTGRAFFDAATTATMLGKVATALRTCGVWDELGVDWLVLDAEILPWSLKAEQLIRDHYGSVGAAASAVLPSAVEALRSAVDRGLALTALLDDVETRRRNAEGFRQAYRRYMGDLDRAAETSEDAHIAVFQILAGGDGETFADRDHLWHLHIADRLVEADPGLFRTTRRCVVDLHDQEQREAGVSWWAELTGSGGEGMVVKPLRNLAAGGAESSSPRRRPAQPGLKVRGREYLRIIYGPDYTEERNLKRLKDRSLGRKRSLAIREYALGIESLERVARAEPLWRVHEAVFGVLALESEPVDPRL